MRTGPDWLLRLPCEGGAIAVCAVAEAGWMGGAEQVEASRLNLVY